MRCLLSKQAQVEDGYVTLRGYFEPLPSKDITFRFEQANIRRKTGGCGEDVVASRLTIGEEVLETEFVPDE